MTTNEEYLTKSRAEIKEILDSCDYPEGYVESDIIVNKLVKHFQNVYAEESSVLLEAIKKLEEENQILCESLEDIRRQISYMVK